MKRFHLIYLLILSSLIVACKDSNSVNIISVPSDNSIAESESIKYTLAVEELINDIGELIALSNNEDNVDLYNVYLAKIDTLLLDKAIITPLNLHSNYTISKVANYKDTPIVYMGNTFHKIKDYILLDKVINKDDAESIYYLTKDEKINYLINEGYNLKKDYLLIEPNVNISTLNPYLFVNSFEFDSLSNCFDSLFKIDEYGNCIPDLVDSYILSEDELTYTFKLRDNINFIDSNGNIYSKIDSDSFIYGFNHLLDTNYQASLFDNVKNVDKYIQGKCNFNDVGIHKIDEQSFSITLNSVDKDFLYLLANNTLLPVDKNYYTSLGGKFGINEYNSIKDLVSYSYGNITSLSNMLYSGAYYPKVIDKENVVLTKNKHYYDNDNVLIENITYKKEAVNPELLLDRIISGEIDSLTIDNVSNSELYNTEFFINNAILHNNKSIRYIGFNTNRNSYSLNSNKITTNKTTEQINNYNIAASNVNFRKAIFHSINREEFISYNNDKVLMNNFISSNNMVLNNDVITEYDELLEKGSSYQKVLSYYIDKHNVCIDTSKNDGIYNKELALSYFEKAKQELGNVFDDVIVIDILTISNNELLTNQANLIKRDIEDTFGKDNIRVDIISVKNQYEYYLAGPCGAKCYDLYYDMSVTADFYSDINVLEKIFNNLIKNG